MKNEENELADGKTCDGAKVSFKIVWVKGRRSYQTVQLTKEETENLDALPILPAIVN